MPTDKHCLDCDTNITFSEPGDGTCPSCGLQMFLTASGDMGRYPAPGWRPAGIQGYKRTRE